MIRRTFFAGGAATLVSVGAHSAFAQRRVIGNIAGIDIIEEADTSVTFTAGAAIDGDGANGQFAEPPCYAPRSYAGKTLDALDNAGGPGNWYGVVTDSRGQPIVQNSTDPCPGAYVSATSLHLPGKNGETLPFSSPFKYVDAATVPFVAVPPLIIHGVAGIVLGSRAVVLNTSNGKSVEAVVADGGPRNKLGEISLACAKAIGIGAPASAKYPANEGGTRSQIIYYKIFPSVAAIINGVSYPLQRS